MKFITNISLKNSVIVFFIIVIIILISLSIILWQMLNGLNTHPFMQFRNIQDNSFKNDYKYIINQQNDMFWSIHENKQSIIPMDRPVHPYELVW